MSIRVTWTPGCGDVVSVRTGGSGWRPALVLSPAAYSAKAGLAVVCPIVDEVRGYPFEVEVPQGLSTRGVVLADRVASLDLRSSGMRWAGSLPDQVVAAVQERLAPLIGERPGG
jgi:mRNA interferase MazF